MQCPGVRVGLRWTAAAALLALLGACGSLPDAPGGSAPPTTSRADGQQLDRLLARQDRVYRLISPLVTKNAVLCKHAARPLLGFTAKNQFGYPPELRGAAEVRLGLGNELQVMQVLDGSGAMRAGLRRGDLLQTIEGRPLPGGPQAEAQAALLVAPLLKSSVTLDVGILRNGSAMVLTVPLTTACAFTVDVGNAPHLNAYSDGRRILVTTGMLDTLSDPELATILAREIAHNVLRHARTMRSSATLSGVIDALLPARPDLSVFAGSAGLRPMEPKLDQQADHLALYMLARAGHEPSMAIETMERLAQSHPATIPSSYAALHPWTQERAALMRDTLAEIRQKQAARKPLVP